MDWCTLNGVIVDKAGHVHVAFVRTDDGLESWLLEAGDALPVKVQPPCRLIEESELLDWLYETADAMGDKLPTVIVGASGDTPVSSVEAT
jgi:hypothetical protein